MSIVTRGFLGGNSIITRGFLPGDEIEVILEQNGGGGRENAHETYRDSKRIGRKPLSFAQEAARQRALQDDRPDSVHATPSVTHDGAPISALDREIAELLHKSEAARADVKQSQSVLGAEASKRKSRESDVVSAIKSGDEELLLLLLVSK